MVRAPDQRLASAYAFGRHVGFGMPKTYRNLLLEASEDTFERYAKFPFVRGCATKMLSSVACAGPPRPVDVRSPLCYPTPANWSALCPDVGPRGVCDATTDCAGPNAAQIRIAAENLERFAFAGITELWDLSLCLFHRLHGGARTRGDGRVSNRQGGRGAGAGKYAATALVDVADEILFSHARARRPTAFSTVPRGFSEGASRHRPRLGRGDAAGASWILRGCLAASSEAGSRRRRGCLVDIPRPGRGDAAGAA